MCKLLWNSTFVIQMKKRKTRKAKSKPNKENAIKSRSPKNKRERRVCSPEVEFLQPDNLNQHIQNYTS